MGRGFCSRDRLDDGHGPSHRGAKAETSVEQKHAKPTKGRAEIEREMGEAPNGQAVLQFP